ncbi:MAG: ABC transporter ATP-binding protein [Anaerolineae bacterium]|nr:ABC transporter ATP-binding protein [Anaerolineae bacterium]
MASIKIQKLVKTFGTVQAVAGIDLDMPDGEFVALLGPSGCGKTTTLRMIAGLEVPDSGVISIGDQDITMSQPRDRDVAMVFQDYALYPHMTIGENIGYPLKVRGVNKAEIIRRVTDVANQLQIGHLLERRPAQLSGGQQQRTALARAVVHRARVFLFDEPLSNLDAKLRLEARAFLKYLQREVGVTGVYVTHDQSEAMALADRIVVMSAGKIMQVGTPLEIYRQPANQFVAAFIGSPPMNLLAAVSDEAARTLSIAGHTFPMRENFAQASKASVIGVRPEHLTIHTQPVENGLVGKVYVTQPLGGETLILVHVGENLISVRVFGDDPPELPEQVWLVPELSRMHYFGEDGERIS